MRALRRSREDRGPRWGLLLLTALQLLVALGVPTADAILEASSWQTPLHLEAPTDEACGHAHDHLFCQLCRVLGLSAVRGHGDDASGLNPAPARFAAPSVALLPAHGPLPAGSPGARAPPRA